MSPGRIALAVALAVATLLVGSRILASAEPAPASRGPLERLAANPLDGGAFADLAKAEQDPARRLALHEIAARRAPRDLEVRAWLVEHHLAAGEPAEAMTHMDVLLRLAPSDMRKALLPAVVELAADPAFAEALVDVLVRAPGWRRALLGTMRGHVNAPGSVIVAAALRERDALTPQEEAQWLEALMKAGAWGQAYALWASSLDLAPGEPLPMLWNGGFEQDPDGAGFGWRIGRAPGSYTDLEELPGARGRAARVSFLGRPVTVANLEQPMHLPPGAYRMSMRIRTQALRSDQGLHWTVACAGGKPRYQGEPLGGTLDWEGHSFDFYVPVTGCPGQWLRLRNPAAPGAASIVSGEIWIDDVGLDRLNNPE